MPVTRPTILRSGRGGYKAAWINPGLGRQKRQLGAAPTISLTKGDSRASVSIQTPPAIRNGADITEDGEGDDDDKQDRSRQFQSGTKSALETEPMQEPKVEKEPDEVQILELHSENPIIVYKGHTFSCRWAENIGTELLFTSHDFAKSLPVLRSLPDDVDLLAASSARIISTSAALVPKSHRDVDTELRHKIRKPYGKPRVEQLIPIGKDASDSRKEQARFLERIMKIKEERGEDDAVTINARTRLYPAGWRSLVKQKREAERARLRLLVKKGGKDAMDAAKELEEMKREDVKLVEEERSRKAANSMNKTAGRKRKGMDGNEPAKDSRGRRVYRRPRRGEVKVQLSEEHSLAGTPTSELLREEQITLSTPTPRSWNDLEDNDTVEESAEDIMDDA